ncbi:synaptic vesicle 2-related protein isoform X1 [Hydra vulgaris]|uniref:synaptic vesicle 2-related protein isoform X1 n=2 Tax=Hydra vulgaris TaxID=6087 RepID=UPI001F5F5969|nr:synaptic vesicle 2-related protein isoform X1 [Hydra vulgaris]
MAGFTSDKIPFIDLEELPGNDNVEEVKQNETSFANNKIDHNQSNESNNDQNVSNSTFSVEDAIEAVGFGKFQTKVLAMVGFAWSADSLEMALLAILAPAIRCEWNLTHWHEAFLTTIVFVGMFVATYFWGFVSDNFGRRKAIILASFGIFSFGMTSSFSVSYVMMITFRGLVGASMGGVVQGTTLLVEFLPRKTRGLTVNLSSMFWSFGTSIEILLAMFVMPRYGWRILLFISAWPCLIFVLLTLIVKYPPESARFLMAKGRSDDALRILSKAAANNKKKLPEGTLKEPEQVKNCRHGSILAMFRKGYWKLTILLWIIWFSSHFNIYGLALLTTALFSGNNKCYGDDKPHQLNDGCKALTSEDYLHFFYVLAADFPAVIITACLADTVGRKWLQAVGFFGMSLFFMLLFICTGSRAWTTVFLFGGRCFIAVADIGGYIYTPEVYPTEIRGMALGSCSGISRVGCMLTPFIAQVLSHKDVSWTLSIYIFFGIVGAICSLLLPIETKGRGLEEINIELRDLHKTPQTTNTS